MTDNEHIIKWKPNGSPTHSGFVGYVGKAQCFFVAHAKGANWWLVPVIPWDGEYFASDGTDDDGDQYFCCASLRDCHTLAEDMFMAFFKDLGDTDED